MFATAVQPSIVSLFSSTGSDPLSLFASHADTSLPSDSFVCILNDAASQPTPPTPRKLMDLSDDIEESSSPDYALGQSVLHIQSPTIRTTYIRCPPAGGSRASHRHLGLKHPWIHLQVRNLHREWAFEVGLADQSGREGVVRCATFQKEPNLKLGSPPLLLLPLSFPPPSSRPLTSWCTVAINLPSLLPHFSSAALTHEDQEGRASSSSLAGHRATQVPSGVYSHVSYVKVYANCRLRRIWFSEGGPQQRLPWEFQLYAAV
ncbi:uncharacterized protein TRAVEDRAFT_153672 [Trametes versicolor FP-101664 SS1]|uniref:uncharacterized protein n=1 Tax=Trametes versicolor (strain FP-101664) TaxID=717944 RepID=UPI0004623A7C|nr:uncharacterized protein TRAVEDRAFT_153672 [Trametes versicolor FP-101664 SS1]EIW55300.1 hypothetical protein TRAVEDRAFT_153672 [Trametes versicolor FP-101664 SS1]